MSFGSCEPFDVEVHENTKSVIWKTTGILVSNTWLEINTTRTEKICVYWSSSIHKTLASSASTFVSELSVCWTNVQCDIKNVPDRHHRSLSWDSNSVLKRRIGLKKRFVIIFPATLDNHRCDCAITIRTIRNLLYNTGALFLDYLITFYITGCVIVRSSTSLWPKFRGVLNFLTGESH